MNDPRLGLPSASSTARLAACPRSFQMERGLPDNSTTDSERGTRIHAAYAGEPVTLEPEEHDLLESIQRLEFAALGQWAAMIEAKQDEWAVKEMREWRMWLLNSQGDKLFSGQADVVHVVGRDALVLDAKTGRGDVPKADENLQLRALAVLLHEQFPGLQTVTVGIIAPLVSGQVMLCQYDKGSLEMAKAELLKILSAATSQHAELNAGDHCKYCKAASQCPAVHKEVETLSALTIHQTGLSICDEDIAHLRDKCGPAKKMIAAIEAEAFRRAQADPEGWRSKFGYEIKEGAGKRAVQDVGMVTERLYALGADWPTITKACGITIKSVQAIARAATGAKGKGLNAKVDEVLSGAVFVKKSKPSLCKVGESVEEEGGDEE
jgi:hypothetical protein